jgi:hypothetical protein
MQIKGAVHPLRRIEPWLEINVVSLLKKEKTSITHFIQLHFPPECPKNKPGVQNCQWYTDSNKYQLYLQGVGRR